MYIAKAVNIKTGIVELTNVASTRSKARTLAKKMIQNKLSSHYKITTRSVESECKEYYEQERASYMDSVYSM